MSKLRDGKFLITGAASGIGRAVCVSLLEEGAFVVAVDRSEEGLLALCESLPEHSDRLQTAVCDLCSDFSQELFDGAVCDGKKLTGLVHCAGIAGVVPLKSLSKKSLEKVMDINFYSFVELARQYSKKKYSDGGSIVGISSLAAVMPRKHEVAYIASKAALNAAIPCLAIELGEKNIRVNGIMPGVVDTRMIKEGNSEQDEFIRSMEQKTLLGAAQPCEMAEVVKFLLSDQSKIITGRVIPADGGMLL